MKIPVFVWCPTSLNPEQNRSRARIVLFGLELPLLIFREPEVSGGVFDNGVTDVFIHHMPTGALSLGERSSLKEVFLKWHAKVARHYYGG